METNNNKTKEIIASLKEIATFIETTKSKYDIVESEKIDLTEKSTELNKQISISTAISGISLAGGALGLIIGFGAISSLIIPSQIILLVPQLLYFTTSKKSDDVDEIETEIDKKLQSLIDLSQSLIELEKACEILKKELPVEEQIKLETAVQTSDNDDKPKKFVYQSENTYQINQ